MRDCRQTVVRIKPTVRRAQEYLQVDGEGWLAGWSPVVSLPISAALGFGVHCVPRRHHTDRTMVAPDEKPVNQILADERIRHLVGHRAREGDSCCLESDAKCETELVLVG
jgi:hypothetical protein